MARVCRVFVLFAVLLLCFACASKETKPQQKTLASNDNQYGPYGTRASHIYMPLAIDNGWTYKRFFLGEEGILNITIVKKDEEGFYVDNKGGKFKNTWMGLRDKNRYMLMAPMEKGHTWRAHMQANMAEHFEIVDDNATVKVPAGTFEHCLIVKSTTDYTVNARMTNTNIYAPNVGMIKMTTMLENSRGKKQKQVEFSLMKYNVKPEVVDFTKGYKLEKEESGSAKQKSKK